MKARKDLILRNLAGEYVLAPAGDAIRDFDGVMLMNELSAFVWERLGAPTTHEALLQEILNAYDVDEETAAQDLDALLARFQALGILED